MNSKAFSLTVLAFCEVAALTVWLSASAVLPSLQAEYALSPTQASLFTSAVQAGFVAGTVISAALGLADRLDARRFFMVATVIAAAANACLLFLTPTSAAVPVIRFITGMCMAGVYPVGMKIATTWAKDDMGLLIGLLTAAVTLGSASPHLFNAFGGVDWRFTITAASVAALAAAGLINLVTLGPNQGAAPPFDPHLALRAWKDRALRFANFGYLGHMWELYAMWAWLGVFLDTSFRLSMGDGEATLWARVATFTAMGIGGAIGCLGGGWVADRWGRTTLAMGALTASGTCALITGFLFGADPVLLFAVCFFWGVVIVADSAQFSASVVELSERNLVGTMLTVQTCAGFLLTLATIHLMPPLIEAVGWGFAFATLAMGPIFGVWAMARLRAHPDAAKLAQGRR